MPHTIDVTEPDIERAHKNNSYKCVVAQAIARAIPEAHHIEVDTQTIRWTQDGQRLCYLTPYGVQLYVIAFDAGEPIEPFSFHLRRPVRVRRKITTQTGKRALKGRRARAAAAKKAGASVSTAPTEMPPSNTVDAAVKTPPAADRERHQVSDNGGRKPPPRVFKTRTRSFGMRVLRVNREKWDERAKQAVV